MGPHVHAAEARMTCCCGHPSVPRGREDLPLKAPCCGSKATFAVCRSRDPWWLSLPPGAAPSFAGSTSEFPTPRTEPRAHLPLPWLPASACARPECFCRPWSARSERLTCSPSSSPSTDGVCSSAVRVASARASRIPQLFRANGMTAGASRGRRARKPQMSTNRNTLAICRGWSRECPFEG
jgi:hypothetical protein